VNAENQRAVDVSKLEHDLSEMETALTDRYCSVGKQLLEVAEREDREINQLVDRIIETRKQLSALQRSVQCRSCLSMNSSDSVYCSHCGAKLGKE
jgi:uncharacterized paraquat-inducible protein A